MRQGQHPKKNRGRNRRPSNPGSRVFESNGPDVKIRGNAAHVSEKYLTLARDAQASGDPIASENYLQHAEHYLRIIAASQAQQLQNQPCAPDQSDTASDGGRAEGQQPRSRGRGRSNGDAAAQPSDKPARESAADVNGTAADHQMSDGDGDDDAVHSGAEPVNGEDTVVAKASSDEPAVEAAEEPAPEAS